MPTATRIHNTAPPRERAFMVGTELTDSESLLTVEESLDELARLADTAGIAVGPPSSAAARSKRSSC